VPALRARRDGSARSPGAPRARRRERARDRPVPPGCERRDRDGRRRGPTARGGDGAGARRAGRRSAGRPARGPRLRGPRGADRRGFPRRDLLLLSLLPHAPLPHGAPPRRGDRRDDARVYDRGGVPCDVRARRERGPVGGHRTQLERPELPAPDFPPDPRSRPSREARLRSGAPAGLRQGRRGLDDLRAACAVGGRLRRGL